MKNYLSILLMMCLAACASQTPRSSGLYLPAIDGPRVVPRALLNAATEVRLYVFDFGECNDFNIFQMESDLNLVAEGVRLTDQQRLSLEPLIPSLHCQQPGIMCFNPHHAIAWFDAAGKVYATAEVCFECDAIQLQIAGEHYQFKIELTMFREYIESLGAPISLARTCERQASLQAPWQTPVQQYCALNAIRLEGLKTLPKNWRKDEHQQSCIRNTREVIF